jgi:hypothetical protein
MAERNAPLLAGTAGAALSIRAGQAGRAIGDRGTLLRGHLTAEIGPQAELIAAGWARAGKRLLRALGRASQAAASIG